VHCYSISGLSVGSEIALPGLIAMPADGGAPDVTIRTGAVPAALDNAAAAGPTWDLAGRQLLLRIPNVARFLLDDGRAIRFELDDGADIADVPVFILGTVFGILLHQREQIVLHASAVRVGGKAVLFCGPSGAGKSTLAAALGERGYPLVTDDFCAVAFGDSAVPMVHADGRQLKLWAQSIDRLALQDRRGARVRSRLEKFYVEPGEAFTGPLPLGAIYDLREARPPHAPGIERPNAADAAMVLRHNAYRPILVRRMQQRAQYFHAATAIARSAGIFRLTRPLDFAAMADVIGGLERHWRDTGLMEAAA